MNARSALMVFVVGIFAAGNAFGQSLEDRLRDQLRQTTDQLHHVQDGQSALEARAVAAEAERDSLKKDVANLKSQLARTSNTSGPSSQVLTDQIAKDKAALAQAASSVREAQADHTRLQAIVANQATILSACQQKNTQLYAVSNKILDRFQHVGWQDALNLSEPFAQGARVDLENIAQDYGDKIYDGKFDPRTVKLPSANTKTATPNDQHQTSATGH